uniref:Uncharacterized protein n=1 Tax=Acrobeloides nanus TaxID=290746 RepID=A0A914EJR5_9BILA
MFPDLVEQFIGVIVILMSIVYIFIQAASSRMYQAVNDTNTSGDNVVEMDGIEINHLGWNKNQPSTSTQMFHSVNEKNSEKIEIVEQRHEQEEKVNFQYFISRDERPANAPDLNQLDYAVWSILEAKVCAKPHKDIEFLKRALIQAWNEITPEILAKIVDNFPERLEQCIQAKGGHFE